MYKRGERNTYKHRIPPKPLTSTQSENIKQQCSTFIGNAASNFSNDRIEIRNELDLIQPQCTKIVKVRSNSSNMFKNIHTVLDNSTNAK